MVLTTIVRSTTKRVPLIKFRKGGPVVSIPASGGQPQMTAAPAVSPSATLPKTNPSAAVSSGVTIEDWQLPPRYRRKPIDPVEMEYINYGGPPS